MNAAFAKENSPSPLDRCTVVVIYDDPVTRARALTACDYLVSQLWKNVELDFYWWRTDFLKDSNMSRAAAHYAIDADFLIVCSTGNDDLSSTLETWFESWIRERIMPEGALIDLSSVSEASSQAIHLQDALRELAKRGKLDYLTSDETQPQASRRTANTLSSVLPASVDRLLDHSRPPSRFGLNE
jgi:hypothetical protein